MRSGQKAEQSYQATSGKNYLEQRSGAASDHVQTLRASLFADLPTQGLTVLDFGCGTGGVLWRVTAGTRIGIEIGDEAAAEARVKNIDVFSKLAELDRDSIDVAISFHAIEHTESPLEILRGIERAVRPGGLVRLIVPGENPRDPRQSAWRPNMDMHLYTWTPLIFGNLAKVAGFDRISTTIAPMPTASRAVALTAPLPPLARWMHARVADRLNSWNVILDATVPNIDG